MAERDTRREAAVRAAEILSLRYFGGPYPESCRIAVRNEMAKIIESVLSRVPTRFIDPERPFSQN
jgi:hypothetical protein